MVSNIYTLNTIVIPNTRVGNVLKYTLPNGAYFCHTYPCCAQKTEISFLNQT